MKSVFGCALFLFAFLLSCTEQKSRSVASPHGADCTEIKASSPQASSGVYVVQPVRGKASFKVYCEMRADGGWTVFQRRSGASVAFNRNWAAYKNGFGDLTQDHWLGLRKVFSLTKNKTRKWILRVDLWDHEGGNAFAQYKNFRLGNEGTGFKLHVGKFKGNAGNVDNGPRIKGLLGDFLDVGPGSQLGSVSLPGWTENQTVFGTLTSMQSGAPLVLEGQIQTVFSATGDAIRGAYAGIDQNGFGFSTIDHDNDGCSPCIFGDISQMECSFSAGGGWWFSRCGSASLNGDWHPAGDHIGWASGLHWETWKTRAPYSLKATRMMIKSV